ncbi:TetR/AcrR family transcriptional regulator [Microbacterium foliorum]|nr:TetR/AcrR family transcriptional regulator [Microbacterium foliorum]AXL11394.1 TetR/AcrR family transcriptional regulator [Microbacterium foliorum]
MAEENDVMSPNRMPRLQQQRSIDTREAILTGAARVFARVTYAEARYRDVADESGASEGALYFHFRSKADLAKAVLSEQQERMTAVLVRTEEEAGSGLEILLRLMANLGDLISRDEIVQAGIHLAGQPSSEVNPEASEPYMEWVRIARSFILRGVADGSIRTDADVDLNAELFNTVFVGSQVLAGLEDRWASLPRRVERLVPTLRALLSA